MNSLMHRMAVTMTLALACAAQAAVVYDQTYTSFANSGFVPDNNASGWADSHSVSGLGSGLQITGVQVSLNISGGWNGDLYGYLSYQPSGGGAGALLLLLDRVGDPAVSGGYGNTGFAVVLSDAGAHAIENYQNFSYTTSSSGQVQGTWRANDGSTSFAQTFAGLDPNGTWSLFLQDRATGDESQVTSWSLQIQAVPEPTTWALIGFGVLFAGGVMVKRMRRGQRAEVGS